MKVFMVLLGAALSIAAMQSGFMRPITVVWVSAIVVVLCQVAMYALRRVQRTGAEPC